ncbi:peptidase inhibitor 16 [Triplophysa rosa]|uniref:Peptidase inhibitor 16-like n=1 Tax=Triplophysa rosa TaxID=992332 RepID=A0A9W7T9X1_TRIRA|nr:peptidase inhibitor 16 [Triplophysa rosa]KAI7794503.1 putative peptidase inhibitor 16-like [Triplophysa rosa]
MHRNTALRNAGLWILLSLAAGHLTEQQTSNIIDIHNDIRSQVKPSAAFMQKVVWDETLRLMAEAYAAKCIWDHNPDLKSLELGENLFVTTGPFNVTQAMLDWFEEIHDYEYENNNCPEDKMCGHYTQMVWADSRQIGCATHVCDTLEGLDLPKSTLLVCNYYPTGNFEGQRPYESGESCSKCPEELPTCEENICVKRLPSEEPPEATKHPAVSTKQATIPPRTHEPTSVPEEGHRRMEKTLKSDVIKAGSEVERTLAPLLMLVWLSAAFIL